MDGGGSCCNGIVIHAFVVFQKQKCQAAPEMDNPAEYIQVFIGLSDCFFTVVALCGYEKENR
jgi:hypothetical protein